MPVFDEYKAVKDITAKYGLNERDVLSMLRDEADEQVQDVGTKYADAIEIAYSRILDWLETGKDYGVKVDDPADVARFVCSHRRACVWAVLLSKARHAAKEREKAQLEQLANDLRT